MENGSSLSRTKSSIPSTIEVNSVSTSAVVGKADDAAFAAFFSDCIGQRYSDRQVQRKMREADTAATVAKQTTGVASSATLSLYRGSKKAAGAAGWSGNRLSSHGDSDWVESGRIDDTL